MFEVRNLCKRYLGIPALDHVSFIARPGEVTGYLGANGSGKSTTMKLATGLIEPTSGEILFAGRPIKENPMAYRQRIGYVPEEPHLYTHLSGLEYLVMVAQLRDMDRHSANERIHGLLRLFGMHGDRDAAMSSYSKGMRQKILLSAALIHNPDLVLLDEPFSGLDVSSSLILRSLIKELCSSVRTNWKPWNACALTSSFCIAAKWSQTTRSSG
jgi:ABC-2 type transport system ATP-binding protein